MASVTAKAWVVVVAAIALIGSARVQALDRLEPQSGCYIGAHVDEVNDTVAGYESRMGFFPAAFGHFAQFPLTAQEKTNLDAFIGQVKPGRAIAFITLEPTGGLGTVTQAACDEFAALCAGYEAQGIGGIIVRFAHEMNGNWFAWGQQPIEYKAAFRLFASRVHAATSRTAILWAPNYGGQYPFGNGATPAPSPGTPDFIALDTDGNGVLNMNDDPYSPYYPGDDVVDWVGLTLTHWGNKFPWGENEIPEPRRFADALQGNYNGQLGDETAVPDFYALFCSDGGHRKPLAMAETAAFFNTFRSDGASELDIKQAWWSQVFDISGDNANALDVSTHFSKLKLVMWFDWRKVESEAQGHVVDWGVSHDGLIQPFRAAVETLKAGQRYFLTAAEFRASRFNVNTSLLPRAVRTTGMAHVVLDVNAESAADVVIDLLDASNSFYGGTRVTVGPGAQRVEKDVVIATTLVDGATYRWNTFIAPVGQNFDQAYNWGAEVQTRAMANLPEMKIVSAPTANPNPAAVGTPVQFTAAATGLTPLAWSWSFGDGTTSTSADSVQHTYSAAGSYNVVLSVLDSVGQADTASLSVSVGDSKPLTITRAQIRLNLTKSGKDSVSVSGTLADVSPGFNPAGMQATAQIGSVSQVVRLNSKGAGKSGAAAVSLKFKATRSKSGPPTFAGGSVAFTLSFKNTDLNSLRTLLKNTPVSVPLQVDLGGTVYAGTISGSYKEREGKSGLFKR